MNTQNNSRKAFKVILVGNSSVGKSSIILRLCSGKFKYHSDATIGVGFNSITMSVDDEQVSLDCWDTAGQERFRSIIPMYFKHSHAVILVYDVLNRNTFIQLKSYWFPTIMKHYGPTEPLPMFIVAVNKMDLVKSNDKERVDRQIKCDMDDLMLTHNISIKYYKTSALSGENIQDMFIELADTLQQNDRGLQPHNNILNFNESTDTSWGCCGYFYNTYEPIIIN